jgi:hypothetical protein
MSPRAEEDRLELQRLQVTTTDTQSRLPPAQATDSIGDADLNEPDKMPPQNGHIGTTPSVASI